MALELQLPLLDPHCFNMQELPSAVDDRTKASEILRSLKGGHTLSEEDERTTSSPLFTHLSRGLALTTGSALGSIPPSVDDCLAAFVAPNSVGLTAGARAWTKHAHRSQEIHPSKVSKKEKGTPGWWGYAQGPKEMLNEKALGLFWKLVGAASWRNLHWLPHQVLVYEMRVPEGYGMRWSQDKGGPWVFRGFVEPMIANGHLVGWRH